MPNMLLNVTKCIFKKNLNFSPLVKTSFFYFLWPKMTSNDLGGQMYIPYVASGRNMSIHVKHWVYVCCS